MTLTDLSDPTAARGMGLKALVAVLAFWLVLIGLAARDQGRITSLNPDGVQWALAFSAVGVLAALLAALVAGSGRFGAAVRGGFLFGTVVLVLAASLAAWRDMPLAGILISTPALIGTVFGLFLTFLLALKPGQAASPRAALGALTGVAVFASAQFLLVPAPLLAPTATQPLAFAAPVTARDYALAQEPLLSAQIAALPDGRNGRAELFALLVAGDARQSVFLSEVEGVRGVLDAQYAAGARSLVLANSRRAPLRYPQADWTNLDRALAALAGRMGAEDVLFLFLTTHGNTDRLSLAYHPAAGRTEGLHLDAEGLADLIAARVTGPLVAVISACKSGSFIDELAADDRLIITASAADRVSFGCRDGADWTYFGREFFDTALRETADPREAYRIALPLIEAAEARLDWARPSQPQMSEGNTIGAALDRLLRARPAVTGGD